MEVLESKGSKSSNSNIITPGCAVLLDINNGDKLTFAHLNKNARVKIGDMNCWLDALIGNSFGSVFEVQSGPKGASFVRVLPSSTDASLGETEKEGAGAVAEDDTQIKDNRGLIDNNTAQTLSAEDIHKMRAEGASGKMIMEALVANSATFQGKTAFSQEKYLRKKQKKYAPRVVVRRPSARSVCEAYFAKDPNKIGFLRMDMLALMLSLANVGANAEVLVLDMLGGLLTAAVAERLGGYGSVCSMYHTSKPQTIDMVRLFNFDAATSSRVVRASLLQLLATKSAKLELLHETKGQEIDDGAKNFKTPDLAPGTISIAQPMEEERVPKNTTGFIIETQVAIQIETEVGVESREGKAIVTSVTQVEEQKTVVESRIEDDATAIAPQHSAKRRADSQTDYDPGKTMKAGRPASDDDMERWGRQGFTSLIVGAPYIDPWTVAEKLLPLLASSAPFVIYHPYLQYIVHQFNDKGTVECGRQPLADCMNKMQTERMAVALQLQEPWLREYQVLPSRTHPNMQMSSTGGWVLTGIRTTNV